MKTRIGAVVSQMDIHHDRTQSTQEEIETKMNTYKEITEAAKRKGLEEIWAGISCIRAELEETIKHRLEDVLVFLDQGTLPLREELKGKIEQTQSDLQGVTTVLDHRIQVKIQATMVEPTRHGIQAEMIGHGRFPPGTRNQSERFQNAAGRGRGPGRVRSVPEDKNRRGRLRRLS
jgi:hypothetical protein